MAETFCPGFPRISLHAQTVFPDDVFLFNVQKIHQIIVLSLFKIVGEWDIMEIGKQLFYCLRIGGLFIRLRLQFFMAGLVT